MAKAKLVLPDGTKVDIEGTVEEVAILLGKFSAQESSSDTSGGGSKKKTKRKKKKTGGGSSKNTVGPTSLITELADEGFFKSKRVLRDIQKKLEERGHIYARTSISPALTVLTRKRTIRRLKENKKWVYVK